MLNRAKEKKKPFVAFKVYLPVSRITQTLLMSLNLAGAAGNGPRNHPFHFGVNPHKGVDLGIFKISVLSTLRFHELTIQRVKV